jgi:catechol 2,3-dioxygenase-like lactoylglutathione lyase family enzyme
MTSFAPQFLVDDLDRAIAYYQKIGFIYVEDPDGNVICFGGRPAAG